MVNKKFHKISWNKFHQDCIKTSRQLKNIQVDKIIAISRGGLVPARIFSDLLSIPVSHITISSYVNLKQQKEPIITEVPSKNFNNKKILIIDEVSDSGKTFKRAFSYFENLNVSKIYTLAPYIKPQTKFEPNFWKEKINAWIIFPYDIQETFNAFLKEEKSKLKAKQKMIKVGFKPWELKTI